MMMSKSNKQLGPRKFFTCQGCSMLDTNIGLMKFSHACKKGVWDGFIDMGKFH